MVQWSELEVTGRFGAAGVVGIRHMLDCYRFCYSFSGQNRAFWGKEAGTDAQ